MKFHVINTDSSYRSLLGPPWLHEKYAVPLTLHQRLKYIKDDEMYRIDGEIQQFGIHEIHYDDAGYFVDTPLEDKLSTTKDNALKKVIKTTKLTQKKVLFLLLKLQFESDIESSEEEGDDGDMEITCPSSRFMKEASILEVMILMERELHSHNLKMMIMMTYY